MLWKFPLPQPPHISIFIWEKTVRIIAAILDIVKPAAVNSSSGVSSSWAGESVHKRTISAVVTAAFSAHAAAGK